MARVTAAEVSAIIDTSIGATAIEANIAAATEVVTEVLGTDTTISATLKKEIERWLTAHLIASTQEQQVEKAGVKGGSITFQGKTGMGLESTQYGQQVMVLDTTGKMRAQLCSRRASVYAVRSFSDS